MYRVIKGFFDLQDGDRWYESGATYPREGYKPTEKRIAELAGNKNRQRTALIEEVKTDKSEEPEANKPEGPETDKPEEPETEKADGKPKATKKKKG